MDWKRTKKCTPQGGRRCTHSCGFQGKCLESDRCVIVAGLIVLNKRELEKFMSYGFFHCLDSFLFIFTFLPLRMLLAVVTLVLRIPLTYLGLVT